jgi:diacylglycerol kinase family enzyme
VPYRLKIYLGRIGYLIWAIWCLTRFKPFILSVDDGQQVHRLSALEVRIANGRFHGGVEVVETSDIDSGSIVVQAVTGRVRSTLIWNWLATLLRLPARHQTVQEFRGRKLEVRTEPRQPISIDGEVSAQTPVVVTVARGVIEVIVPDPED